MKNNHFSNSKDNSLSDYEKLRLAKIARNEAKLASLGLGVKKTPKKKKHQPKKIKVKTEPTRRSSRLVGVKLDYKEDSIALGTSSAVTPSPKIVHIKKEFTDDEDNDEFGQNQQMLDKMKREIQKLQHTVFSAHSSSENIVSADINASSNEVETEQQKSKRISLKLWGDGCSPPPETDWKTFLSSRTPSPSYHLPSPYGMMQEVYAHDGWRLLICCVLMSRVSSSETKDRCIRRFFDLCPLPSDLSTVNVNDLQECVHSLGFQYERVRAITEVTKAWLTRGDFKVDSLDVKKGGNKIYMCGPFAVDSYELFCKGNVDWKPTCGIRDVVKFANWLKKAS